MEKNNKMTQQFDVVVIGGGPGGYVSAIRAAQCGLKTAVIEREHMGGICLNWGCIPTKALLKASDTYRAIMEADEFGISVGKPKVDIGRLIKRSRDVAGKLNTGVGFLMKKNGIAVIEGEAYFKDRNTIEVTKSGKKVDDVKFTNAIIATGARAREIPGVLESDGKNIWTYKEAMTPKELPKSLLVIGAGAIGIEFASFYNTLGVEVDVVEALGNVLPVEDVEVSKIVEKSLKKQGVNIYTKAKVNGLKVVKDNVVASLEIKGKAQEKTYDKALVAIGVQGNVEGLGLEKIGVNVERGAIVVDEYYRTNAHGIYAIGDVVGAPWLAHVASHEGVIAAEHIAGKHPHTMDYDNIPGCTYCTPQVGSVGLTEAAAKKRGHKVKIGRFDYQANGKALATGEDEGLVKTVFDAETGELLGAHICGAEATEMVTTFVVAKQLETTEKDIIEACLPHPTLSEMLGESVLDSDGRVINA